MKKNHSGFTLIELIVVIIILGILAAFALPRFADLDKEARKSVTEGLGGSIRAAAALAHGKLLASNPGASAISMEGVTIAMVNKYPATNAIEDTIVDISGFTSSTGAGGSIRFVVEGVSNGNSTTCMVEYTQPATVNDAPNINVQTTQCG